MSLASASLAAPTMPLSSRIRMLAAILLVVVIAEAIGSLTFTVGPGKIILQPMLWAIFIGAIVVAVGLGVLVEVCVVHCPRSIALS